MKTVSQLIKVIFYVAILLLCYTALKFLNDFEFLLRKEQNKSELLWNVDFGGNQVNMPSLKQIEILEDTTLIDLEEVMQDSCIRLKGEFINQAYINTKMQTLLELKRIPNYIEILYELPSAGFFPNIKFGDTTLMLPVTTGRELQKFDLRLDSLEAQFRLELGYDKLFQSSRAKNITGKEVKIYSISIWHTNNHEKLF